MGDSCGDVCCTKVQELKVTFFTCIGLKVLTLYSKKSTDTAEQVLNLTIRNIRILALKRVFGFIILILQTCKLRPWKGEALSLVPALIQSAFDL